MFKQPLAGIVAATIIMALSLGFISLFDYSTFTGWVSFALMCLIPMEIMVGVIWGANPPFVSSMSQPMKGITLVIVTAAAGAVMGTAMFYIVGGGVSPPTPMLVQCTITSVIIMFWATIIMGGWPYTTFIKNPIVAGLVLLVGVYIVNYILFRIFFNYDFLVGAPVYVPELDPHGLFNGWSATVFYVTFVSQMFLLLHFDLWPLTKFPGIMKQPVLGIVFTIVALVLGSIVFYLGVNVAGMDVVQFMVTIPIPFIFGTIIVLNMMQDSLFKNLVGPVRGLIKAITALIIGMVLSHIYSYLAGMVTGEMSVGAPTYEFEIWLASALLAVTFPCLICLADFFGYGGLLKKEEE